MSDHSYDKRYNLAYAGGYASHYVDTLDEVRRISREVGGIAFVDEGYGEWCDHGDGFMEVVRRTTRAVPLAEAIGLGATREQRREALVALPGIGDKLAAKILDAIDEADTRADVGKHRALMGIDGRDGLRVIAPELPVEVPEG